VAWGIDGSRMDALLQGLRQVLDTTHSGPSWSILIKRPRNDETRPQTVRDEFESEVIIAL